MSLNLAPETYEGQFNVRAYGALGNGSNDDTAEVQAALDAAFASGGGVVRFPQGTYNHSGTWVIKDNVTIECDAGVTIERTNNAFGYLLQNGTTGVAKSGYAGHSNITVRGGIWDMNGGTLTTDAAAFAFGHASNITFENLTIKDVPDDHAMDLTALNGVRVKNCRFIGYNPNAGTQVNIEAIQIDYAGTSHFPPFGTDDNTPCKNVIIEDCYFGPSGSASTTSWANGIGNHDSVAGNEHTNIVIRNNVFEDITNYAIHPYGFDRLIIEGNTFINCGSGVHAVTATSQSVRNYTIANNIFRDMGNVQHSISIQPVASTFVTNLVIANNVIDTSDAGGNSRGIYIARSNDVSVTGNTINTTGHSGIVTDAVFRIGITNNTIYASPQRGIDLLNSGDITVGNNVIRDITGKGIYLSGCNDAAIQGNTVQNTGEAGIQLSGGSRNTVSGNQLYDLDQEGILLSGSTTENLIVGNHVRSAGRGTNATYGGIGLSNAANSDNCIINNRINAHGSGNEVINPIHFAGTTATGCQLGNNSFKGFSGKEGIGQSYTSNSESTSSTSYVGLTTAQAITMATGTTVRLDFGSNVSFSGTSDNVAAFVGVEVSGATTRAIDDAASMRVERDVADATTDFSQFQKCWLLTGLTPGMNTFTLKFKIESAVSFSFDDRTMIVTPVAV